MADDADASKDADVKSEITLDDFKADEVKPTEPSPEKEIKEEVKTEPKTEKPQAKDTKEEKDVSPPDVPTKADKESEDEVVESPAEDKPKGAEERKAQLNTEIRDLVSQRNALKAEVEKANAEVYQPATENELVDQGMSATDAKVEALRQEIEMKNYNEKVADAQLTLSSESERVLNDFPIFNSESDQYDKELAEEAAELLAGNLITDPNTEQIIGSNVSPYQLYKTLARASGISATKGQLKGQKDTEQMLANADAGASVAPEKKPVDPLIALWRSDD